MLVNLLFYGIALTEQLVGQRLELKFSITNIFIRTYNKLIKKYLKLETSFKQFFKL